jgi:hypothetical protein
MLGLFPADPYPALLTLVCKTWPSQLDTRLISPSGLRDVAHAIVFVTLLFSRFPRTWAVDPKILEMSYVILLLPITSPHLYRSARFRTQAESVFIVGCKCRTSDGGMFRSCIRRSRDCRKTKAVSPLQACSSCFASGCCYYIIACQLLLLMTATI